MFTLALFTLCMAPSAPAPKFTPPPTSPPTAAATLKDRETASSGRQPDLPFLKGQAELLLGDRILKAALRRPEVKKLAVVRRQKADVVWLRDNLLIRLDAEKGEMAIQLKQGSRREQAIIVNAVARAHVAWFTEDKRKHMLDRLEDWTRAAEQHRAAAKDVRLKIQQEMAANPERRMVRETQARQHEALHASYLRLIATQKADLQLPIRLQLLVPASVEP